MNAVKVEGEIERKGRRGGKRVGAGRKKSGKKLGGPHRARPSLSPRHPVHVVLRTELGVPRLRDGRTYRALRKVLERYLGDRQFRIVHLSIQHNHLHLLVEADDRRALRRGMQSFAINAARAINARLGRTGKVFAYRYHATQIVTARQARNALAYVLTNWRRHREDMSNRRAFEAKLDPYASGLAFSGWTAGARFAVPPGYSPLPVSHPQTALLRADWRRHGLLDPYEKPGPIAWFDLPGVRLRLGLGIGLGFSVGLGLGLVASTRASSAGSGRSWWVGTSSLTMKAANGADSKRSRRR